MKISKNKRWALLIIFLFMVLSASIIYLGIPKFSKALSFCGDSHRTCIYRQQSYEKEMFYKEWAFDTEDGIKIMGCETFSRCNER